MSRNTRVGNISSSPDSINNGNGSCGIKRKFFQSALQETERKMKKKRTQSYMMDIELKQNARRNNTVNSSSNNNMYSNKKKNSITKKNDDNFINSTVPFSKKFSLLLEENKHDMVVLPLHNNILIKPYSFLSSSTTLTSTPIMDINTISPSNDVSNNHDNSSVSTMIYGCGGSAMKYTKDNPNRYFNIYNEWTTFILSNPEYSSYIFLKNNSTVNKISETSKYQKQILEDIQKKDSNINSKTLIESNSINERITKLDAPLNSYMKIKPLKPLWEHQEKGLEFLINRENDSIIPKIKCHGGMNCDEPGTGKTMQYLQLILEDIKKNYKLTGKRIHGKPPTLIVSHRSIIDYWVEQIKIFYPMGTFDVCILSQSMSDSINQENYMKYDIIFATYHLISSTFGHLNNISSLKTLYHNNKKESLLIDEQEENIEEGEEEEDQEEILSNELLTINTNNSVFTWIFKVSFSRLICDEADYIVNQTKIYFKSIQKINAKHRWYVTGTPIRNSINDLKNAFIFIGMHDDVIQSYLKDINIDNDIYYNIDNEESTNTSNSTSTANDNNSHKKLSNIMIRRTKNELKSIFSNNNTATSLIHQYVPLMEPKILLYEISDFHTPLERECYNIYANKVNLSQKNPCVLSYITIMRQMCKSFYIINNIKLPKDVKLSDINENTNPSSPLSENTKKQIFDDSNTKTSIISPLSTKGRKIIEFIRTKVGNDEKVVIFDYSVQALKRLMKELKDHYITCILLSGEQNVSSREGILKSYQNTPANGDSGIKVLLFTQVANQGISLVCASVIIHLSPGWTPWPSIQANYRLHRAGQKKQVIEVYYYIKDTIEEYVMKLSKNKLFLHNRICIR